MLTLAFCNDACFKGADLSGVNLYASSFYQSRFGQARLHGVKPLKDIGRNFYLLADYPAAEAALRRYCDQSPDDKQAHDLLGYVCYRQGKFMASFAHYERARRLDPLNPKLERNARLLYSRSAMN